MIPGFSLSWSMWCVHQSWLRTLETRYCLGCLVGCCWRRIIWCALPGGERGFYCSPGVFFCPSPSPKSRRAPHSSSSPPPELFLAHPKPYLSKSFFYPPPSPHHPLGLFYLPLLLTHVGLVFYPSSPLPLSLPLGHTWTETLCCVCVAVCVGEPRSVEFELDNMGGPPGYPHNNTPTSVPGPMGRKEQWVVGGEATKDFWRG